MAARAEDQINKANSIKRTEKSSKDGSTTDSGQNKLSSGAPLSTPKKVEGSQLSLQAQAEARLLGGSSSRSRFGGDKPSADQNVPSRSLSGSANNANQVNNIHADRKGDKAARMQKLQQVFAVFDLDGGGTIECSELLELGKMRQELGQKSREWNEEKNSRLVKKMDENGDGVLSCTEFVQHFELALSRDSKEFDTTMKQFMGVAEACRRTKQSQNKVIIALCHLCCSVTCHRQLAV